MSKRFVISESDKREIRNLYKLNEESVFDKGIEMALKNLFGGVRISSDSSNSGSSNSNSTDFTPTDGKVKIVGNFDSTQIQNINLLINAMNEYGIKDPLSQIGILSVINKECNFKPKGEVSYATTSNDRIRKLFGKRVANYSDSELNNLKKNDKEFFNVIYAKTVGNQGGDDGWNYRGRGFNQLTGIKNYEKYGNMIGMGNKLVENPELVNDPEIAAKIAIAFFTKNKSASSLPKFNDKVEAASYFADVNSGGGASSHRENAIRKTENFDVQVA
jgi:predicted chitinase